jgi:hypothetical protein
MKLKFLRKHSKTLPVELEKLINLAASNHDSSGEFRRAMAELQARTSWNLNKATEKLNLATWILAVSTVALCFITFYKG